MWVSFLVGCFDIIKMKKTMRLFHINFYFKTCSPVVKKILRKKIEKIVRALL